MKWCSRGFRHISGTERCDSFEYWMMKGELERLVDVEGPVLLSVAAKRLASYWNVNKCTEWFVDRIRHALS